MSAHHDSTALAHLRNIAPPYRPDHLAQCNDDELTQLLEETIAQNNNVIGFWHMKLSRLFRARKPLNPLALRDQLTRTKRTGDMSYQITAELAKRLKRA